MASQSTADIWMGAATSDISMPSNPVLNLEDESSWKTVATSSQNTANMDVVKDNVGASRVLEEDWYTTEESLMDLSYSSPYGNLGDPRSSFGSLLDSSPLTFDTSGNVNNVVSFHHSPTAAPPTSSMGVHLDSTSNQRQLTLEDLAACNGQGSSVGLLSSISPGGQLGRSNNLMDSSFSSGLPTPASTFNRATFPGQRVTSFTDTYNTYNKKDSSQLVSYKRDQSYPNQPTLFQKRAASRGRGGTISPGSKSPPRMVTSADNSSADQKGSDEMGLDGDDYDVKDDEDLDESGDGSGGPYEVEEGAGNGGGGGVGKGNGKGKRGLPAKNLMAERRRRKKLNDRLYMLRSVVPKITKMDRASILGDAIEYLKELLQRINDIHKELEAAKADQQSRSMPSSPTPRSCYAATVKEECPVLPNPESQTPRVEVRKREGQALNIHMFCARRPGLLLSTVRALDALGLDVQQAVISCFNGFALDLFRAEAKNMEVGPDEIKAVLLLTAGCGMHQLQ